MELLEIESERRAQREELATWLHELADSLARHNELSFKREGLQYRVKVPDEVGVEVELEIEDDGTKLEIEISW